MRVRSFFGLIFSLAAATLSGCGGGGDGGAATPSTTIISGMASKGPIRTGTVKVFAIRSGVEDRSVPIGEGGTDAGGDYTVDVGSYKGPLMVEVSGGSYMDEVSGTMVALKTSLRAVFSNASTGRKTVAVTPLTELAFKKAKGKGALTAASIDDSNASIAASFKLTNIISTLPTIVAGSGDDQKKYATACGSFSQLANNRSKTSGESLDDALKGVMDDMGTEMEKNGGLSTDTVTKMNDAITEFSNSDKNKTGGTITPIAAPTSGILKMATFGGANNIAGIDLIVNFPAGVKVKTDANGEVASGVITISGVAALGDSKVVSGKFVPAAAGTPAQLHIIMVNATGFGLGEFATVRFDLDTGGSFPAASNAFSVTGFSSVGQGSTALSGITAAPVSVSVDIN